MINTKEFYKIALEEIENKNLEKNTWAKAYSKSDGNADKANSLYIKYRVSEMQPKKITVKNILYSIKRIALQPLFLSEYLFKKLKTLWKTGWF